MMEACVNRLKGQSRRNTKTYYSARRLDCYVDCLSNKHFKAYADRFMKVIKKRVTTS